MGGIKALSFAMLFMFGVSSMYAQNLKTAVQSLQDAQRSTELNLCFDDVPEGPTVEDIEMIYVNSCSKVTVTKSGTPIGDDCSWSVEYTYDIQGYDECSDIVDQIKITYDGSDQTAPELNDGASIPDGGVDLNLCYDDIPEGPSAEEIGLLFSDNCNNVNVVKTGSPSGDNCSWQVTYSYEVTDDCGNIVSDDIKVEYSGGDSEAPNLLPKTALPQGEVGLNLCFEDKSQGPSEDDIAALYSDNCGDVVVTKTANSKGTDCKWLAVYSYTVADSCGNVADEFQLVYQGFDSEDPVLAGIPDDITVDCIDEIPSNPKGASAPTASDNCDDNVDIVVVNDDSQVGLACEGGVFVRTWTATDNCGNEVSQSQTVTINPAPAAEFSELPQDMSMSCAEAEGYQPANLGYSNGVSEGACAINGEAVGELSGSYTECGGALSVTWSYEDECGRAISHTQNIEVLPAPMAEFDPVQDMEITCEEANAFEAWELDYSNGDSGNCEISGKVMGELTGDYNECGGTLSVDWFFKDNCDRDISAKVIVTVLPAPQATFDNVEDMEISCEEANDYSASDLAYTNGGTEGCEISGSVTGVVSGSFDECGGTLYQDWSYTDNCGRTINAQKVISVMPAPMAEFAPVDDLEISCEEANSFAAGYLSYTNGGTQDCEISGEVMGELSGSFDECGGELYVDWFYKDDCDRDIAVKQTITVLPAPQASFENVEDMEISCEEANDYQAGSLGYSNAGTDACDISGSVDGLLSGEFDECGGTLYVDWSYTDDCGRTIDAQKVITVMPAPMAEFAPVDDLEISCEEANSFAAGYLSYTNGGTQDCEISGEVMGVLSGEFDECGGTLYVDWLYKDDCDRDISAKQTINVLPAPMAEFENVEDVELSCEEANEYQAGYLAYSNQGSEACDISGEVMGVMSGSYDECGGTLYQDWSYTDDCGREITAQKVITVLPAPGAEFVNPPANITISCEQAALYMATSLDYSNGGSGACAIEGSVDGVLSGEYDECGGTLYVDWFFKDDCDRDISYQKVITVSPSDQASFDNVEDMEITCEEALSFSADSLSYSNGESGPCAIEGSVDGVLSGDFDECGGTLYVDWSFTDNCDRTITAQKVVTVVPAPMAEFDAIDDLELTCEEANAFAPSNLGYSNGGTQGCEISGEVAGELSGEYDECGGTLYVDWYFKDDCEREISHKQTITVLSAPEAVFEDVIDMEITCEEANDYEASYLSYSNGGSESCDISGQVMGYVSGEFNECGGTLYQDWSYTDDCGRTIDAQKIITVLPAPQAQFDGIDHISISCEEANVFEAGYLSYTNGGTQGCEISGEVMGQLSGEYTECGGLLFVDWSFTDYCGRTITHTQQVKVDPAPQAEFEPVEDLEISCEDANSFEAYYLSYSNDGTEGCDISGEVMGELSGDFDECGGTLYVDWFFKDECDRDISAQQTITVLPAPMAEFNEPVDVEISCEEANVYQAGYLWYSNQGTGSCVIEGDALGVVSGNYDECGGTLYEDYSFTDDCGRTINAQKVITVMPAPMAEFAPVENIEISCEEANSFEAYELDYSNGGTEGCEISGKVMGELSGEFDECGGELYIDWTFKDDCDRDISSKQTITVLPAPMAEFAPVVDMEITCEEANDYQAGYLGYSNQGTGSCVIEGEVMGYVSGQYSECGGTLYEDWYFVDDCGRTIAAQKVITVLPAPMAEWDPIDDLEISCEEANSFEAGVLGYSNGGTQYCTIEGEAEGELSGEFDECGGTLYVDWFFKDNCDRDISYKQTITVLPAPMAEFDNVEDMEITCEEANDYQVSYLGYSNEGTGSCIISGEVMGQLSGSYTECGGTLYEDWSYTDDCGRTINAQKVITVQAAPMAEWAPVDDLEISCEDANTFEAGYLSYSNGGTQYCAIEGEVMGELTGEFDECGGTLYVDWFFKDNCDREIAYKQTITVLPAPMAQFEDVSDYEIACEDLASFDPGKLSYSNQGTGGCVIEGEVDGVADEFVGSCGEFDVNWSFVDDCGREITASITVTVIDETAPVMVLPLPQGESNVDAVLADIPLGPTAEEIAAIYEDNCGNVNVIKSEKILGDDCDWAVMYSYEVYDDCGNYADTVKVYYNGSDQTAPELVSASLSNTLSDINACYSEIAALEELHVPKIDDIVAIFADAGVAGVLVTANENNGFSDDGDCGWSGVFAFSVADGCGNQADDIVINLSGYDSEAPVLVGVVPDGENEINACLADAPEGPSEDEIRVLYSDNCGEELGDNVNVEKITKTYGDDCSWIVVYEYIITDDCGNDGGYVKVNYQGMDQDAPVFADCEAAQINLFTSLGAACPSSEAAVIALEVGDELDLNNLFSVANVDLAAIQAVIEPCFDDCQDVTYRVRAVDNGVAGDCSRDLSVSFEAVDGCDNVSEGAYVVNINISEDVLPSIAVAAGELIVQCDGAGNVAEVEAWLAANGGASASYLCNALVWSNDFDKLEDGCGSLEVEFTATDACGREVKSTGLITVQDSVDPEMTAEAQDGASDTESDYLADFQAWLDNHGGATATDNCGEVTWMYQCEDSDGPGIPEYVGTFDTHAGPFWTTNPAVYTGQEAAALLFGGDPEDYIISTDPVGMNNMSWSSTWGIAGCAEIAHDHKVDLGNPGYNDPGGNNTATSAYVQDNCGGVHLNYVYRVNNDCQLDPCGSTINNNVEYVEEAMVMHNGYLYYLDGTNGAAAPGFELAPQSVLHDIADQFVGKTYLTTVSSNCCIVHADEDTELQDWGFPFGQCNVEGPFTIAPELDGANCTDINHHYENQLSFFVSSEPYEQAGTTVTFTATDECGNSTSTTATFIVNDATAPDIKCEPGVDFGFDPDLDQDGLPYGVVDQVHYSDNCDEPGYTSDYSDDLGYVLSDGQPIQGFTGDYAPGNWSVDLGGADGSVSINASTMVVTGNDDGQDDINTQATITCLYGGVYSFNWDYLTNDVDGPGLDPAFYLNGAAIQLTDNGGADSQSGFVSVNCAPGDVIGFRINSSDGILGDASLTISNFEIAGPQQMDYTLVRTFTATDAAGNSSECDITYTWSVPGQVARSKSEIIEHTIFDKEIVKTEVELDFTAYPVPFDKEVNIAYNFDFKTDVTVELFDTKGLLISAQTDKNYIKGSNGIVTFDLSRTANQMFYVQVTTSQGKVTKKIVSNSPNRR
ncbi:MAG: hypothetical protein BM564_09250 [Bacteroidetes bacterium MedPE-SWsnd-G2]|nr:MAG: hypothetical protein BM564_09250 [Bacteroidetes bacterium MedPE-SWsnd-G2]